MTGRRWAGLLLGVLLLAGCGGDKQFTLNDITGIMPPLQFTLTDSGGRPAEADDYHNKVTALYFGYTHCPDICPFTLGLLSQALGRLGSQAADVRVLFVSVDPARDTPEILGQYAAAFGPQFVGLTGTTEQLEMLARRYRVAFSVPEATDGGDYAVAHSSGVFIFDREGDARLLGSNGDGVDAFAHDLRLLVDGT